MTLIKRKNDPTNESFVRTTRPAKDEEPPSKRLRREDRTSNSLRVQKGPKSALSGTNLQLDKPSIAKGEDAPFPRGGASVLTPLEHRQIQIEATRDVLFEQQGTSRKQETRDEESIDPMFSSKTGKKRKSKIKGQEKTQNQDVEGESVKIEGLSYKVCLAFYE
jgi:rRNA biogenesis protein RRP5